MAISGGQSSTTALGGSTEAEQFHNDHGVMTAMTAAAAE